MFEGAAYVESLILIRLHSLSLLVPLLVKYIPLYSPEQHRRHEVSPGISGWAQVNGRNNITWTKKFEYDVYYVDHIGPMMDGKVFFTTIKKVLLRKDINQEGGPSATMEAFNGKN